MITLWQMSMSHTYFSPADDNSPMIWLDGVFQDVDTAMVNE